MSTQGTDNAAMSSTANENRGPALLVIFWVEVGIATLFVLGRAIVRTLGKNWWWDDYTMMATWVCYVLTIGLCSELVVLGLGRHMADLTPSSLAQVGKWTWIVQAPGIMTLAMTKVTVTLLILRLIGPNTIWRKRILIANCVLFFMICTTSSIISYGQCDPPRALWELVPDAKCWDPKIQADFATFGSAYAAFCDFFLALMPVTIIWPLKMSVKKKITLCALLGLGAFSGICAALKAAFADEIGARTDVTWVTFNLFAWSSSEIFINVICGCAPSLKPLWDRLAYGKPLRTTYRRSGGDDSQRDASGKGIAGRKGTKRALTSDEIELTSDERQG